MITKDIGRVIGKLALCVSVCVCVCGGYVLSQYCCLKIWSEYCADVCLVVEVSSCYYYRATPI